MAKGSNPCGRGRTGIAVAGGPNPCCRCGTGILEAEGSHPVVAEEGQEFHPCGRSRTGIPQTPHPTRALLLSSRPHSPGTSLHWRLLFFPRISVFSPFSIHSVTEHPWAMMSHLAVAPGWPWPLVTALPPLRGPFPTEVPAQLMLTRKIEEKKEKK